MKFKKSVSDFKLQYLEFKQQVMLSEMKIQQKQAQLSP
ncbi:hypothetical protein IMSAGC014_01445 [Bacteroidaceae bacterium]|nr:hypothetical protein IMSAGC014_01445 [Bacteroidaceae bacterium]